MYVHICDTRCIACEAPEPTKLHASHELANPREARARDFVYVVGDDTICICILHICVYIYIYIHT